METPMDWEGLKGEELVRKILEKQIVFPKDQIDEVVEARVLEYYSDLMGKLHELQLRKEQPSEDLLEKLGNAERAWQR